MIGKIHQKGALLTQEINFHKVLINKALENCCIA